jgi:hypothetical protein
MPTIDLDSRISRRMLSESPGGTRSVSDSIHREDNSIILFLRTPVGETVLIGAFLLGVVGPVIFRLARQAYRSRISDKEGLCVSDKEATRFQLAGPCRGFDMSTCGCLSVALLLSLVELCFGVSILCTLGDEIPAPT